MKVKASNESVYTLIKIHKRHHHKLNTLIPMHSDKSDGSISALIVWHYNSNLNNIKGTTRLRNRWFFNTSETVIEGIVSIYVCALPELMLATFNFQNHASKHNN